MNEATADRSDTRSDAHSTRPVAAILAGGQSRRMGRDKAGLNLGDTTFLDHVVRAAEEAVDTLLVVGRFSADDSLDGNGPVNGPVKDPVDQAKDGGERKTLVSGDLDVQFLEDDRPGMGPLGGLATALRYAGLPVLLLACDMPLLDAATVQWLVDAWGEREDERADGLVSIRDQENEPFFSVYAPSILSTVEQMLDDEDLALRSLLKRGRFETRQTPPWIARRLANVNTPEDYRSVARGQQDDDPDSPFPFWQNAPK